MRRFRQLFRELDQAHNPVQKVAGLKRYLSEAPAVDAAWALWALLGNPLSIGIQPRALSEWTAALTGLPSWLIHACNKRTGDAIEASAFLIPFTGSGLNEPLGQFIESHLMPLSDWDEGIQFQLLRKLWARADPEEGEIILYLLSGRLPFEVSECLVVQALAELTGLEVTIMAYRLASCWSPTAENFHKLCQAVTAAERRVLPYPFHPVERFCERHLVLSPATDWVVDWVRGGLRLQLVRRTNEVLLWSCAGELVTAAFPELSQAGERLPDGTVLEGELVLGLAGRRLGLDALQKRMRERRLPKPRQSKPPTDVIFYAFDCLEWEGQDVREEPLSARRKLLKTAVPNHKSAGSLSLAWPLRVSSEADIHGRWREARSQSAVGLFIRRSNSVYGGVEVSNRWFDWRAEPLWARLVLVYAEVGEVDVSKAFSSYTLAAWEGGKLVSVGHVCGGLSETEQPELDAWIGANTLVRRGPTRTVPPSQVFEVAFDGIGASPRRRSGTVWRGARMVRWLRDADISTADTAKALRALIPTL